LILTRDIYEGKGSKQFRFNTVLYWVMTPCILVGDPKVLE